MSDEIISLPAESHEDSGVISLPAGPSSDSEFNRAIASTNPKMDQPVNPTKYNDFNTATPRQTLAAYDPSSEVPIDQAYSTADKQWPEPGFTTKWNDLQAQMIPTVSIPHDESSDQISLPSEPTGANSPVGTLAYVAHHFMESARQVAISGGQLAATAGMPDALDAAMKLNEGKPYTSPEEEEGRNTAEKFMGKVADTTGTLGVMAGVGGLAALAGPELGLAAAIGGGAAALHGALQQGRTSIDQGTDLTTAQERSVFAGTVGAVANYIPIVGTTLGRSMALGASANVVGGVVERAGDKAIAAVNDYQKIADEEHVFDKGDIATDLVFGTLFGSLAHTIHEASMSPAQRAVRDFDLAVKRNDPEAIAAQTTALQNLGQAFGVEQGFSRDIPEGSNAWKEWNDYMFGPYRDSLATSNIRDTLLAIADPASPAKPQERILAQTALRMGETIGMLDTKVTLHGDDVAHPEGSDPAKTVNGQYSPEVDHMTIYQDIIPSRQVETSLHEVVHAMLGGAVNNYLKLSHDGNFRINEHLVETAPWQNLSPESQNLMYHIEKFHDNYVAAKQQWEAAKIKGDHKLEPSNVKKMDYAFSDLNEYATHVMTNEVVQRMVNTFKVDPTSATGPNVFFKIHNRFLEHKNAVMAMLTGGEALVNKPQVTALIQAQDHMYRMMNDMTQTERQSGMRGENPGVAKDAATKARQEALQQQLLAAGQWNLVHKIAGIAKNAGRFEEFKARLQLMSVDPQWRMFVEKNAQHLWNKSDDIVAATEKNHRYNQLSAEVKKIIGDPRHVDEFFKDIKEQLPPDAQKIPGKEDIDIGGTWLFGPDQLRMIKGSDTMSGQVYNWFASHAQEFRSLKAQVYAEWKMRNENYTKLPYADKIKMMGVVAYFDHGLGLMELKDKKLQWATPEMLAAQGLNEKQIQAYQSRADALDWFHDRMNDIRLRNGQAPLDQKPGYMPHVWTKPYKVLVERTTYNPDGTPIKSRVVEMHDFATHFFAKQFVKRLGEGRYDGREGTEIVKYSPSIDPDTKDPIRWAKPSAGKPTADFLNDLGKTLEAYNNVSGMGPEVTAAMEKMHSDNMVGYSKHLMERTEVKGFIGDTRELTGATKMFGMVPKHGYEPHVSLLDKIGAGTIANKLIELDQNYAKSLSEYYGNTLFMKEVVDPAMRHMVGGPTNIPQNPLEHQQMWGGMLDSLTYLKEHMRDYTHNFTGQNLNYLAFLDREITYEPTVLLGLSPTLLRDAVNYLRNTFSLLKLRGNPGFYLGNVVQQLFAHSQLSVVNSLLKRNGIDTVSLGRTMAEMAKELPHMSVDLRLAEQWARDNHVLESLFEGQLRHFQTPGSPMGTAMDLMHKITGGDINPAIENWGRTNTFLFAYKHFRLSGFDVEASRVAAAQIMRQSMTDYMRESRPLMFQNTGVTGQAASPFQVYRSAQVGNMFMAFKALRQSGFKDWAPIASLMTIFGLTAGAVGVPLMAEINQLAEFWNDVMPEHHMPSPYEMMRKIGFPEWLMFGGVSESTKVIPGMEHGMYVGSSMNSVALDESIPKAMLPFVEGLAQTVKFLALGIGSQFGATRSLNRQDIQTIASTLVPSALQGVAEWGLMPEGSDVAPASQNLKGEYEREPADWNAIVSGRKSMTETIGRKDTQVVESRVKQKQEMVKSALQNLVDHQVGKVKFGDVDRQWEILTNPDLGGLSRPEVAKRIAMIVAEQGTAAVVKDADLRNYEGAWRRQIRDDLRSSR